MRTDLHPAAPAPLATPRPAPASPPAEALELLFEMVDAPAAVCDAGLRVTNCNAAFERLCGQGGVVGRHLGELLSLEALGLDAPSPGAGPHDVTVRFHDGASTVLTVTRRGGAVGLVARRLSPIVDTLAAAGRALLEQARVETALLDLGRAVALATSEEDLVATVVRGLKGLFPGRAFCVRIADPRTGQLSSSYAEGRLREGPRDVFHLRPSMVARTHLEPGGLPAGRVQVHAGELPLLFHGTVHGLAVPLVASGQLYGALNLEDLPGAHVDAAADERVLVQLANQVAVAVRTAKLIEELTQVRRHLEDLIEHANALVAVVDRAGRFTVFNAAFARLTGRPRAEVLGTELARMVPGGEQLAVARAFDATLRGEAVDGVETAFVVRDGREARVAFNTSPVLSAAGAVEGVMVIGHDLTRVRELERGIIQAEKLASLGQLAASVVHEINNPMTAVVAYADALLQRARGAPGAVGADVAEKMRRIVDNAERVLRFTRDLAGYARPARDRPEEVDLVAVVERAAGYCDHEAHRHGVTLERRLAPVPPFDAVPQDLVQVFVNLVTNACHATPPGGRVTLSTSVEGGFAVASVADTGTGMPPEVKARLFEPFFTTKPDGRGTGLGLSIVEGIVARHGGSVTVASAPGQGSCFTVKLPLARPAAG